MDGIVGCPAAAGEMCEVFTACLAVVNISFKVGSNFGSRIAHEKSYRECQIEINKKVVQYEHDSSAFFRGCSGGENFWVGLL